MANDKNKVHFTVALKALDVSVDASSGEPLQDIREKVKPLGEFYFVNPHIVLQPDDWIVWGVASTDDVDLQSEFVDVREVFGDFLQEFVESGKIFYEHGYRLAGKVEPSNRIDEPIGVPYMVEIFDNALYVWVLLDKNHELAKKVWESMQSSDPRMRKWGFSIGGIYVGTPKAMHDPVYGKVVKLPKIRLYEISITPQPVNTKTWASVVKSFIEDEDEETMAQKAKEHVDPAATPVKTEVVDDTSMLPEDLLAGEKPKTEEDGIPGAPEPERVPGSEVVKSKDASEEGMDEDVKKPEEEEATTEDEAKEPAPEAAEEETPKAEEAEPASEEGANEKLEGEEFTPEAEKESMKEGEEESEVGEEDDEENALAQLLGEEEVSASSDSQDDAALDVVLDKVDMLSAAVREIKEMMDKLMEVESQEHGEDLAEEATGEEEVSDVEEIIAKAVSTELEKALAPVLDTLELVHKSLIAQKSMFEELEYLREQMKEATGKEPKEGVVKSVESSKTDIEEVLEKRESSKVAKSVGTAEEVEEVVVPKENEAMNFAVKSLFSKDVDVDVILPDSTKEKFSEIANSPEKIEVLKGLVDAYRALEEKYNEKRVSPSSFNTTKLRIIGTAKSSLGLREDEFMVLVEN